MEITKTTTIVWASEEEQLQPNLDAARSAKINQMISEGKTNGALERISPTTSKRFWKDQSASEEFISFIMAQAELWNCDVVSTLIEDYTAPV
jgi:hypothetical protein